MIELLASRTRSTGSGQAAPVREHAVPAARVAGTPLTVAVRRALDGTLRLSEARGDENGAPTPRQLLLLPRWIAAMDAARR